MLREVAQAREEAKAAVRGEAPNEQTEELPEGASPFEARAQATEDESETTEEAPEATEGESTPAADDEEGEIRIGDQVFTNPKAAYRYAEQLEREKILSEAHAAGVREALEATRAQTAPAEEPEEDFDASFYANPKGKFKEVEERATAKALAIMQAEQRKETLWNQFLSDYPEIRRKDAERVLRENSETIGKITDTGKGMKALAQLVRSEYQEIASLAKPRTALPNRGTQGLSPSGGTPRSVTQQKKEAPPLDFISQMKKLKG